LVIRTGTFPGVATSATDTATVTCVAEPKVTVRTCPPTVAVAPLTKPEPATLRGKLALPATTTAGLTLAMIGVGLTAARGTAGPFVDTTTVGTLDRTLVVGAGSATVKICPFDVPPPGAGVETVMLGVPTAATSPARRMAVSWVAETKVVSRGLPLIRTMELPTKFVPLAVRVAGPVPGATLAGLMLASVGAGGGATTEKASALEVPPPETGVATLT
jgi:hypothetical protein